MRPSSEPNHYELLDVTREATLPEIERAYRIARSTYRPDSIATYSVFSDQQCADILRRVEEAYLVLSDARMRREYDARLRRESSGLSEPAPPPAESLVPVPEARAPAPPPAAASLDEDLTPEDGIYDGTVLRRIRISRGVELEEISGVTKVNELYLQFIEENRYHDLPAPVYLRGFLKGYAKCLRLDPAQVANSYMERVEARSGTTRKRA
ncbi:MAG: helix-turn-helix domain-containing protein [Myxococcota bacterium]